ncbi:MAG: alkaline phosphatase family protein [Flavobacteriales bacterium]|nr:alkaline phosphatase family protein [Flavobacteriales bacterium]
MNITRCSAQFLALSIAAMGTAQGPTWQNPPKLVVGIVVDQMRTDYIYRYWNNFGEGGFKRMVHEGAFLRDAHFDHVPTETGPGHAGVYTGTTPSRHGIVANEIFQRATQTTRYCASAADSVHGVGCDDIIGRRSPENLLTTTIADELERRTDGLSKTIGIAIKDRGAILPMGRTGDAAYWFAGGADGAFVTSTWYTDSLPPWVLRFNGEKLAASHLGRTWDLLLPEARYRQALPDENGYEAPLAGAATPTLPLDLKALFKASGSTGIITSTPWGNTLTTDFALAALSNEGLGTDPITDLLAISYSSTDILGHRMGPRAIEVEDMYLRLDLELARLFAELDKKVGKGQYTVFLTADHAAPDVPQYLKDLHGSAGYVDAVELEKVLERELEALMGPGRWVRRVINEQVFLNDSLITAMKFEPLRVQRAVAEILLRQPFVAEALCAIDLMRSDFTEGVRPGMQRGFMPSRSGDVLFAYRPGYFEPYGTTPTKGTTHGSAWNYDTHVPILFMGKGIMHREITRRASVTDIAPTIALLVGMTMPDGSTGCVLGEALAP